MARHRDDVALLGVLKVPMASLRSRLFPAMLFGNRITSRTFIGMTLHSTGLRSPRAVSAWPPGKKCERRRSVSGKSSSLKFDMGE